ncbi:hypothetical protein N665_0027s0023 [Sinapis alba]|nr:hypothetical protein N665_0027s0023 [Sinapis alba]
MAILRVFFSELKSDRCSSTVEARFLRFWEAKNVKQGGELMWVDMLMVDGTIMQTTISVNRLPAFRPRFTDRLMYYVSGFDVARCAQNFRLSHSSLMIRFNDSTLFDELTEPVSALPEEVFRFRNQTHLIGVANTNTQLPDIVAELTAVKRTLSDPPEGKNHVMATVKLDNIFDSQVVAFQRRLESKRGDLRVIVATNINLKMFDKETSPGQTCFYGLIARDTGLPSAAPLLRGYAVESLTIYELNSFVMTVQSQNIEFICTVRVTRVDAEKGWCYAACSNCAKKLQCIDTAFTSSQFTLYIYRVEMAIADEMAEGVFICFDGVMTKLHILEAHEAECLNPKDSQIPPIITDMEGKTYTFHVKVTTYNFTASHQTFTITHILDERDRANPLLAKVES